MMVQLDRIGSTATEGVPWIQRVEKFESVDIGLDVWVAGFHLIPLTFPDLNGGVAFGADFLDPLLGLFVNIVHGTIEQALVFLVADRITFGATMPKTAVDSKTVFVSG